jgi:hypothetical protein
MFAKCPLISSIKVQLVGVASVSISEQPVTIFYRKGLAELVRSPS